MAVTPTALITSQVATGGVAVQVMPGGVNGGFLVNPSDPADQGIVTAEVLYVDPVNPNPGSAPGAGNGTCFAIYPGQSWSAIPGQTTPTFVNAGTSGHKFSGVKY